MAYGARPMCLDEHRDALAALWRENMSDGRIADVVPDRMRWLYEQNPAGPTLTWLGVVTESDEIVGCGSIFPRDVLVGGRIVRAGVLSDFAVTKAHRIAGAAIAIQRALAKGSLPAGVEFLYGYPNAKSIAVCKRVGHKVIGESSFWVKPLRSAYKLREHLPDPRLVPVAAVFVDAGLAVLDVGRSLLRNVSARAIGDRRSYATAEVERADGRFDDLWTRARGRYRIVGEKSSAYLNWRYNEFTTRQHRFFCLDDAEQGILLGYAVYRIEDNKAFIEDFFCEDLETTAEALLLRLSSHLRRKRVDSLVFCYLGSDRFGERLKAVGFLKRPGEREMVVYVDPTKPEAFRREVAEKDAWFMIDGELDI